MKPISTALTPAEKLKLLGAFVDRLAKCYREGDPMRDPDTNELTGVLFQNDDTDGHACDYWIERAREISDKCSWCDLVTFDLPSHWASALINGDWSGLDDKEAEEVRSWLAKNDNPEFSSVDNDRIERGNDATSLLCDTSTYTCLVPKHPAPTT